MLLQAMSPVRIKRARFRKISESSIFLPKCSLIQLHCPGHVAEHVINDAAGFATVGEAAGGGAGGVVMDGVPRLAAIGAAEDAFAAVEGAHEHDLGFHWVDVERAAVERGELGPGFAGVGAFQELGGACAFVAPVVLVLAVADEKRRLVLRMMGEAIHDIGGVRDFPGLAAIMAGIEAGAFETLQIHMLAAGAGDEAKAVLRFQRVLPCLAAIAAFEDTELVIAKVHHVRV